MLNAETSLSSTTTTRSAPRSSCCSRHSRSQCGTTPQAPRSCRISPTATSPMSSYDVRMPDMSGTELQEELKRRGNQTPIVLITGHGHVAMAVAALKAGAVDFIEKPFTEAVLLDAITRALETADKHADAARRKADLLSRVNS